MYRITEVTVGYYLITEVTVVTEGYYVWGVAGTAGYSGYRGYSGVLRMGGCRDSRLQWLQRYYVWGVAGTAGYSGYRGYSNFISSYSRLQQLHQITAGYSNYIKLQ